MFRICDVGLRVEDMGFIVGISHRLQKTLSNQNMIELNGEIMKLNLKNGAKEKLVILL